MGLHHSTTSLNLFASLDIAVTILHDSIFQFAKCTAVAFANDKVQTVYLKIGNQVTFSCAVLIRYGFHAEEAQALIKALSSVWNHDEFISQIHLTPLQQGPPSPPGRQCNAFVVVNVC